VRAVISGGISAQRQKASKVGTELNPLRVFETVECSTPKGIKGWDRSDRWFYLRTNIVLNAKRHQRLGQQKRTGTVQKCLRCSTPKGIKGWDRTTMASRLTPSLAAVLNAKRHQRLGQRTGPLSLCPCPRCAQRLTASKVGTDTNGKTENIGPN